MKPSDRFKQFIPYQLTMCLLLFMQIINYAHFFTYQQFPPVHFPELKIIMI